MRLVVSLFALVLALPAAAQEVGDVVELAESANSLRFYDADVTGPVFEAGVALRVLYVEGDRVRLRRGDRYGWVNWSELVFEAPAEPVPAIE